MPTYEDAIYAHYKRARNRIRKLESTSFIRHSLAALQKCHTGGMDVLRYYQPWNILLALRWVFQEFDAQANRRRAATKQDLHEVLNIIHQMEGDGIMPSDFDHVSLFMRRLAFQQFWRHRANGSALARQEVLFAQLPSTHQFHTLFKSITGVSITDFLDLSFALLSVLIAEKPPQAFKRDLFSQLEPHLPPGAIDGFLRHLSRSIEELHTWLIDESQRQSVADQFVLPSPLMRAPFYREHDLYAVYYPPLAFRALEESVYRTLRAADPEAFMQKFGPMFERHVERCLREAKLSFETEKDLLARLPGTGKVIDFLITNADCDVLIDAKGVEPSTLGRVATDAVQVYRSLKESAMKAIVQGMQTALRLAATRGPSARETFLIVVTFEPLYLGCSSDLSETFGTLLASTLQREIGPNLPFPLQNIFFLSIAEFEGLVEAVLAETTTIPRALRHARSSDADPKTKRFNFGMHLDEMKATGDRLPFIEDGLTRLQQHCVGYISPQSSKRSN